MQLDSLVVPPPPAGAADWNSEGVLVLPDFIDSWRIDAYCDVWRQANARSHYEYASRADTEARMLLCDRPGGWPDCTPYMRHPEILDLVAPLAPVLAELVGEPAGMNLNLTGWVTTQRDWHQDSYLNEPEVGDHYAAVWIALDDIHPDSGPFQYVPGSHRWPQVTRGRIGRHVDLRDPQWPKRSETFLTPLFTEEIAQRGAQPVTYLPEKGDVLVWHGRLLHRGSVANIPNAYRPALIAHFSGIDHRPQMPAAVEHPSGGWFFPIANSGPV
jgi:ectoine hydroxylase-related dioxygenase (phytanoyl-CoA dioxygenase family)